MEFRNIVTGLLIIAMIGVFTGCETDQKTLLTDGIWNFKGMTTDIEDETTQDLIFIASALMSGSTMEFKSDGTYMIIAQLDEGSESGTWSLIVDDQLILTPEEGVVSTANIDVLSKSELKYIETYFDLNQDPYTITTTWSR